eukprot:scaffold27619_cov19-Tisochrysis_lutea.AAC.2
MEVLVPTRKVTSKSASGRKTSRTIKYMDGACGLGGEGGLVFLRCILTNDLIDFVQELPYFRSWRDEVGMSAHEGPSLCKHVCCCDLSYLHCDVLALCMELKSKGLG